MASAPASEAGSFAESGNIAIGGALPVNTHGGQLSYGYTMAMAHTIEAVRQLRGNAGEGRCKAPEQAWSWGMGRLHWCVDSHHR